MPYGLQIFNADTTIDLDTNTRTGRILGTINITEASPNDQNFTIPRAAGELCFCTGMIQSSPAGGNFYITYTITTSAVNLTPDVNGNNLNVYWNGSNAGNGAGILFYGVR
jgi:hypothetical protein